MKPALSPVLPPAGVADCSRVRRDLIEILLEIGGSTSIAITMLEEGTLDDLRLALGDVAQAASELPRLEARVLSWERRFGSLRQHGLARAGR